MVKKIDPIKNCYVINAPAGSGKTTTIENMILDIIGDKRKKTVLCITYTNRAANELMNRIEAENIEISTIHSFINQFIDIYFTHEEIIDFYFEVYKKDIKKRIENNSEDHNITISNQKYFEAYGELNLKVLRKNIKRVNYNELQFSSLYTGGLSHDELLNFTYLIIEKYPKIKKRLSHKYDYIFIDEYQDTSANVLRMFYKSVLGTKTQLYLFGDKMQQIYKNYDGSFEEELNNFDSSIKLRENFRSLKPIVDILNAIYNDKDFKQKPHNKKKEAKNPTVIMTDEPDSYLKEFIKESQNTLQLVIYNSEKFKKIGSENLFKAFQGMERYRFGRKYSAVDVLTLREDNPDDLMKLLFTWDSIFRNYNDKYYGKVIQCIKKNPSIDKSIAVNYHNDKTELNNIFKSLFSFYNEDITIGKWLEKIEDFKLLNKQVSYNFIDDEEYKNVLNVKLIDFFNLLESLDSPIISTQHGVKGEGHDKVIFIADNSINPSVKMYDFFQLWMSNSIVFKEIQTFYYSYKSRINEINSKLMVDINKMKASNFKENKSYIMKEISHLKNNFKDNIFFRELYGNHYINFFSTDKSANVTNMKKCLKISTIEGILNAYKLFYVGCSRAKKELTILLDTNKIKGEQKKLIEKFKACGFQVEMK